VGVKVAGQGFRIECGAGLLVRELFEGKIGGFAFAQNSCCGGTRILLAIAFDPFFRSLFYAGGKGWVTARQLAHAFLETRNVELIDTKSTVAALRATGSAGQPIT
jgi:hypothetical protein